MADGVTEGLSRRERQIMDVIYRLGSATAADIQERLPDAPSNSAVRGLLRVLLEKGQVRYHQDGPRYVYEAPTPPAEARASALRRVLRTFFDDSPEKAVAALLDLSAGDLSDEEYARLEERIREAREREEG